MTMNNSSLSAGVIILENKLPLRPATKWRPTWSGGLQVLVGGMGDVGRAEKKREKQKREAVHASVVPKRVRLRVALTLPAPLVLLYVSLVSTNRPFFFFWLLQSSLISSHAVGEITREHRATGNAN